MTYREKLKMEHPEKVNKMFIGGCNGCPSGVGYGPESVKNGCIPNEAKCTACWNKVIPGTEDNEGMSKEIEILKEQIKKLEQKNEAYSRTCDIYKSKDAIIEKQEKEIERRGKLLVERDDEIENYKKQVSELAIENTAAAEKIEDLEQKIQKLEGACRNYNDEVNRLNKLLNKRDDELKTRIIENNHLKDKIDSLNVDREMQTYGTCCCKPDVIAEKDKEIERLKKSLEFERFNKDYWYDELLRHSKKIGELINSNQELKDALEEEKKEHAKHHSLFGKYFAD